MTLKERLTKFIGSTDEVELQILFKELSQSFLYGGFLKIRDDYQIFIKTVEFYFHSEKSDGIHDPIVYHRNVRNAKGVALREVPYFPLMTLHAHNSGFDITFENEERKYRASALIRAYEVKDNKGDYLIWAKNKEEDKYMFFHKPDYNYNTQSTYLYSLLNGFPLGDNNDIKWIDAPRLPSSDLLRKVRKNVFKSENEWIYSPTKIRCQRIWSFTRMDKV